MESHRRFEIAQERLGREHDIQHIIEMNRVTHLLHKIKVLARQRRVATVFARQYVISTEDIAKIERREEVAPKALKKDPKGNLNHISSNKLLEGFDEERNRIDRRIFYEVTGR